MQAAIGVAQLDKLNWLTQRRKYNFDKLYKGLERFSETLILPEATPHSNPSWFCFIITVRQDAGFSRNELTSFLERNGIETRNIFCGNLTRQPAFLDIKKRLVCELKNTDLIMNNTFFIGLYPGIDNNQIDYVVEKFSEFFDKV